MKTALIQMSAGADKKKNITRAVNFIRKAASEDAKLVLLPECFIFRGNAGRTQIFNEIAEEINGPTIKVLKLLAKELRIYLLAGSIFEKDIVRQRIYNTAVLIGPDGKKIGVYRKNNLFCAKLKTKNIQEADIFNKGTRISTSSVEGFRAGTAICYDLRFPALFGRYQSQGCDIIMAPSNFTHETGKAHWEVLVRARAIENKCYILAPNQVGRGNNGVRAYGNSMAVDPQGRILARSDDKKEEIIFVDVCKDAIDQARIKLP